MNFFRSKLLILFLISAAVVTLAALVFAMPTASTGGTLAPEGFLPLILKPAAELPDLTVPYVSVTLEDPTCYDGESMGLRVHINNIDVGDAGPFVVDIDGDMVTVAGLAGGDSTSVWVPGYSFKPLVIVDATHLVEESNEDNNTFNENVPIPTLPLPCDFLTRTPTP